jgi:hypothetical protein
MYEFSDKNADEDGPALWALQCFLKEECEKRLGEMDPNKHLYQPVFNTGQPHVINTPTEDGAFASLSDASRTDWPTTLYELAHETVHLLNPVVGCTNYIEEGLAVYFSVDMSANQTVHSQKPDCPFYLNAWNLAKQLPADVYTSASIIRKNCGSLSAVTPTNLLKLFPSLNLEVAEKMCSECNFT